MFHTQKCESNLYYVCLDVWLGWVIELHAHLTMTLEGLNQLLKKLLIIQECVILKPSYIIIGLTIWYPSGFSLWIPSWENLKENYCYRMECIWRMWHFNHAIIGLTRYFYESPGCPHRPIMKFNITLYHNSARQVCTYFNTFDAIHVCFQD